MVSPGFAAAIAACSVSYCVPSMVAACFTSPVVSLPLPPSPSIGAGLLSPVPSLDSPPLTGASKGFKASFPPFCSSPEEVEVPVVSEGGGSLGILSAVLRCAY